MEEKSKSRPGLYIMIVMILFLVWEIGICVTEIQEKIEQIEQNIEQLEQEIEWLNKPVTECQER